MRFMAKLAVVVFMLAFGALANADPISLGYTISGSAGAWQLDFSVTNNLTAFPSQDMYFFGVLLDGTDILASPSGWITDGPWNTSTGGSGGTGPNVTFDNTWIESVGYDLDLPGNTVSGFEAGDTSATEPTSVQWFAMTFSPTEEEYTGGGNYTYGDLGGLNPGFTGTATLASAVPEPSTLPLAGLGLVCLWMRRSKILRSRSA
jgi:hypothetical protein